MSTALGRGPRKQRTHRHFSPQMGKEGGKDTYADGIKLSPFSKPCCANMTTDRKFSAFNSRDTSGTSFRMREIPEGGMCISSFVILSKEGESDAILLGKLDPTAPWDHIGALDGERAARHAKGWMIPSSHLMIRESPQDAARRVLREQLNLPDIELRDPKVVSEVSQTTPGGSDHWDLEFIFTGHVRPETIGKPDAWSELRFVKIPSTRKSEISRRHEDVLESI